MNDRRAPDTRSSRKTPCPICNRSKDGDCKFSDEMAWCHHGSSLAPPLDLREGDVITGADLNEWAFVREGEGMSGSYSTFVRHRPQAKPTPSKQVTRSSQPSPTIELAALPGADLMDRIKPARNGADLSYADHLVVQRRHKAAKAGQKADKVFVPHHLNGSSPEFTKGAGPDLWPLWHQSDLEHVSPGQWVLETEGEVCANYARTGGVVSISQPGHDHTDSGIAARYAALVEAKVGGVIYLADNDKTGREKAQRCAAAAAGLSIPMVVVHADEIHPELPPGGSIDDLCRATDHQRPGLGIPPSAAVELILEHARHQSTQLTAAATEPLEAEPKGEAEVALPPIDEWDQHLKTLVDPNHPCFEKNCVRRQIRAATSARDLHVSASPQHVRAILLQHQRNLLTGTAEKGTQGGAKAKFKPKKHLINNLIAMRCLTGISAFNKVGKTKLATELASSLIFQHPFMNNPEWMPAPPPPGGHKLILWWVDQPGADTEGYLKARGLMEPDGTLHPQIVKLYTEEDDLAWDDQGMDQLIRDTSDHPGAILITDSFFACIQRIHGNDQEPEAGGALIDVQTLLSQTETTHICLFHSPKETGPVGINAIRGHSSAGGAVSGCISMHFLEKKDPQTGKWVADKENPHRRMVFEGRGPYIDLLIRGEWEQGTFKVLGNFQQKLGELTSDQRKANNIDSLTAGQRKTLEWVGAAAGLWKETNGVTVSQVASAMTHPSKPTTSEIENTRKQLNALVKAELLTSTKKAKVTRYNYRDAMVDVVGTQSEADF